MKDTIIEFLKHKGVSQTELANRIGWSPSLLGARIGVEKISLDTLEKISIGLDCEIHELIPTNKNYAHVYSEGEWLGIRKK